MPATSQILETVARIRATETLQICSVSNPTGREPLNRDGFRVDQYSSKPSNLHAVAPTVAMHESVEFDYFGAPAGT